MKHAGRKHTQERTHKKYNNYINLHHYSNVLFMIKIEAVLKESISKSDDGHFTPHWKTGSPLCRVWPEPEVGAKLGVTGWAGADALLSGLPQSGPTGAGVMTERGSNAVTVISHLSLPQQEACKEKHTRRPFSLTQTCFYCLHTETLLRTFLRTPRTQIINMEG